MAVRVDLYFTPTQFNLFKTGEGYVLAFTHETISATIHVTADVDDIEEICYLDGDDVKNHYDRYGNVRVLRNVPNRSVKIVSKVVSVEGEQ